MMKKILTLLVSCYLLPGILQAQTFNEFFRQRKTQVKYLVKQIAELQVYLEQVKKGYNIVNTGLQTVRSIKNGEFTLHDLYYTSLGLVNPRIRNSADAKTIIEQQQYILNASTELKKLTTKNNLLSAGEKDYLIECLGNLLEDVESVRKEFITVVTDKSLQLTDNERLERLGTLKQRSISQFSFIQAFSGQVFTLLKSMQQEQIELQTLRSLYDHPQK